MKTFYRASKPEQIKYNKGVYTYDAEATNMHKESKWFPVKGCVIVKVQHRNLKGKLDLHNKPYPMSIFIYSKN